MCTNPVTIRRFYPSIGERSFTVPCGKCAECAKKKQSAVQALSLLQANKAGTVHFFTFTYRDDVCPVAVSEMTADGPRVIAFERGVEKWKNEKGMFKNALHYAKDGYFRAASLCREDLKKIIKRFRRICERENLPLDENFQYLACGEYGERRGRPHFHALFYGLTNRQACLLRDLWSVVYGFTDVVPAPDRKLDYNEVLAVSKYVSKYVAKGVYTAWKPLLPYVESPRRQSSIHFGLTDDETIKKLADFTMAAIYMDLTVFPSLDCLMLNFSVSSLIGERVYLLMVRNMLCPKH